MQALLCDSGYTGKPFAQGVQEILGGHVTIQIEHVLRKPLLVIRTQVAYNFAMKAVFVELPAFERNRATYLNDDEFKEFQERLLKNPEAGDMIEGTGGLRKVRHGDPRRGKGTRGGLRVIYYWWSGGPQFWLFTLYDKDELENLTPKQKATLKQLLKNELEARQ